MPHGSRNRPDPVTRRVIALLRAAFDASGLTQRGLEEASGLDQSFISKLFAGHKTLTMPEMFALSGALGLDPAELIQRASAAESTLPRDIQVRLDAMGPEAAAAARLVYEEQEAARRDAQTNG